MSEKKGNWTVVALVSSLFCLGGGVFFGIGLDCPHSNSTDQRSQDSLQSLFPAGTHDTVVFQYSHR